MDYDIDATQVLDLGLDIPNEETTVKREVGKLKTQPHRSLTECEFSVYEGTNIIGRDDRSDIVVKLQSLSKKHACIEVTNGTILVYDLDSRNKSRKGEMLLKPYVRYDINNEDKLTFGDLKCEFIVNPTEDLDETRSLSGSETGSESLIPEDEEEIMDIPQDSVAVDVDAVINTNVDDSEEPLSDDRNIQNASNLSDYIIMPTQMQNENVTIEEEANEDIANTSNLSDSIIMPTQQVVDNRRTFTKGPCEMKNISREEKDRDVFACDSDMEDNSEGKSVPETPGYGLTNRTKSCISESPMVEEESSNEGSVSRPRKSGNFIQNVVFRTPPCMVQKNNVEEKAESDEEEIVGTYVFDTAGFNNADDDQPQTYQFDTSEFHGGDDSDVSTDEEVGGEDKGGEDNEKNENEDKDDREDGATPNEDKVGVDRRKTYVVADDDDDMMATQPYQILSPVKAKSPAKHDNDKRNSFPTLPGASVLPDVGDEGRRDLNKKEDNGISRKNDDTNYDDIATQMYENHKPSNVDSYDDIATQMYENNKPSNVDNYDDMATQMYENQKPSSNDIYDDVATQMYDNVNNKPSDDFDDVATQMYNPQNDTIVSHFDAVDMATNMTMQDDDIDNACTQMYTAQPPNDDDDATQTYGDPIDDAETQLYNANAPSTKGTTEYDDVSTQLYTNHDTSYDEVSTQLYALDEADDKHTTETVAVTGQDEENGENKEGVEEDVKKRKRRSVRFSIDISDGINMFQIPDKNVSPTDTHTLQCNDTVTKTGLIVTETTDKKKSTKSYPARQNKGKRLSDDVESSVIVNETKSYPARQNKGKRFSDESEVSLLNVEPVSKKSKKDQSVSKRGGRGKKGKENPSMDEGKEEEKKLVEDVDKGQSVCADEDGMVAEELPNPIKKSVNPAAKTIGRNARSTRQGRSRMPSKVMEESEVEPTVVGDETGKKNEEDVLKDDVTADSVPVVEDDTEDAVPKMVEVEVEVEEKPISSAPKKNAKNTKNAKSTRQARFRASSKVIEETDIVPTTVMVDENEVGKNEGSKIEVNVNDGVFVQNAPTRSRRDKKSSKEEKGTTEVSVVENSRKRRLKKGKSNTTEEIPTDAEPPSSSNSNSTATKTKPPSRARIPSTSSKRKANLLKESATLDSVSSTSDLETTTPAEIRLTKTSKVSTKPTNTKKKGGKKSKVELEANIQSTPKMNTTDSTQVLPSTPTLCPSKDDEVKGSATKTPLADKAPAVNVKVALSDVDTTSADSNTEDTKPPPRSRNMRGSKKVSVKSKLSTKRSKDEVVNEGEGKEEGGKSELTEGSERLPGSPRRSICKPKVIFTGMNDKSLEKIVVDLGGEVVENIMQATHLVTDKVRRTVKFLCAVGRGIHIVHSQWLLSSKSSKSFTGCQRHTLKDESAERQYKFQLHTTLEKANERPLFHNKTVYVTKSVKPERALLKEMIECAGGTYVSRVPKSPSEDTIVVSCATDEKEYQKLVTKGFIVCTKEIVLSGLLRQQLDTEHFSIENLVDPDTSQLSLSDNSIISTAATATAATTATTTATTSSRKGKRRK